MVPEKLREFPMSATFSLRSKSPTIPTNFIQRIFYSGNAVRLYETRLRAMEFVNQHRVG
jgi:hypothetical protein